MATQLQIFNRTLIRLGELPLTSVTDDTDTARKISAIYPTVLSELTAQGPEKGWKFARRRQQIDVDSSAITAFADAGSDVTTVTSAAHGLLDGDSTIVTGTTSYDGEYVITYVSASQYKIGKTFVADDATGTSTWTSGRFQYRFTMPDSLRIASIQVAGIEINDWVREGRYILTNMSCDNVDVAYVMDVTDESLFPPHFVKVLWLTLAVELTYDIIQSSAHSERLINELEQLALPRAIAMDEQEKYEQEESNSWVDAGNRVNQTSNSYYRY